MTFQVNDPIQKEKGGKKKFLIIRIYVHYLMNLIFEWQVKGDWAIKGGARDDEGAALSSPCHQVRPG